MAVCSPLCCRDCAACRASSQQHGTTSTLITFRWAVLSLWSGNYTTTVDYMPSIYVAEFQLNESRVQLHCFSGINWRNYNSHLQLGLRFCLQNATQPRAFRSLTWWKIRCWMTTRSHLRRQLIDFVGALGGLPASSRSCSTCFSGGSIWWFTRWLELSGGLSPQLSLLPERAALTVPTQLSGPKHCVFWPGTCF